MSSEGTMMINGTNNARVETENSLIKIVLMRRRRRRRLSLQLINLHIKWKWNKFLNATRQSILRMVSVSFRINLQLSVSVCLVYDFRVEYLIYISIRIYNFPACAFHFDSSMSHENQIIGPWRRSCYRQRKSHDAFLFGWSNELPWQILPQSLAI